MILIEFACFLHVQEKLILLSQTLMALKMVHDGLLAMFS